MTHFCCEIICCGCLIDRSQLQLNHWLIHLRNSYNGRHWRRDTVLAAYLPCCFLCVLRWCCCFESVGDAWWSAFVGVCVCIWDAVWGFYVLVFGGLFISRFCFDSLHRSKCHIIGITTSSAKKLPHRVVTLKSTDKGEEEMVFQYRGYGFYVCVGLVLSEVLEEDLSFDGIFLEDHFIQDEVLCFVV